MSKPRHHKVRMTHERMKFAKTLHDIVPKTKENQKPIGKVNFDPKLSYLFI